jgi:hypothetical protein
MSKQISSVEWLFNKMITEKHTISEWNEIAKQAKAMHRQEIVEHHTWMLSGVMSEEAARKDGEQYYTQTFKP